MHTVFICILSVVILCIFSWTQLFYQSVNSISENKATTLSSVMGELLWFGGLNHSPARGDRDRSDSFPVTELFWLMGRPTLTFIRFAILSLKYHWCFWLHSVAEQHPSVSRPRPADCSPSENNWPANHLDRPRTGQSAGGSWASVHCGQPPIIHGLPAGDSLRARGKDNSVRLGSRPGLGHCDSGSGPNSGPDSHSDLR